jgi:hypothetical protein
MLASVFLPSSASFFSHARVILQALIGGVDPSQHPVGVTKNFIG